MTTSYKIIPQGSTEIASKSGAAVYTYEKNGILYAIAYRKNEKCAFHYRFPSEKVREAKIAAWIQSEDDAEQRRQEFKAKRASEKKSFRHGYKPGDIMYSSWGYEQTNIEFYQVISVTEKQVTFREITQSKVPGSSGHDCCDVVPNKDHFVKDAKEFTRTVSHSDGKGAVNFAEYPGGYMKRLWHWDGTPKYCSWYG